MCYLEFIHAGRDCWLSLITALLPALFIGYIVASLSRLFPGKTLIEYSELIVGKWMGKGLALLFLIYFFHDAAL
jgi:spore germination protein KB